MSGDAAQHLFVASNQDALRTISATNSEIMELRENSSYILALHKGTLIVESMNHFGPIERIIPHMPRSLRVKSAGLHFGDSGEIWIDGRDTVCAGFGWKGVLVSPTLTDPEPVFVPTHQGLTTIVELR